MYGPSTHHGRSFNNSELSNGFHLLTESSHNVTTNTPSVPPNKDHLYPRLAGSNWTCYLSQATVILGRTAANTTRQTFPVGIDFGNTAMGVSRRHCEFRFSFRRDRWELYVYGRGGVKVNHAFKGPKDRPVVLVTGSLIEVNKTTFVFILPHQYIKPKSSLAQVPEEGTEENNLVSNKVDNHSINVDLEAALMHAFENQPCMDITQIMQKLQNSYTQPVEKGNVLHSLVLSPHFQLDRKSITMSSKESDTVKWKRIDNTQEATSQKKDDENTHKKNSPMETSSNELFTPPTTYKYKSRLSPVVSTDDMSISSVTAMEAPFSITSTNSPSDDMSAPSTTQNTPTLQKTHSRGLSKMDSADDMSICSITRKPSLPFGFSFNNNSFMFRSPTNLQSIFPPLSDIQTEPRIFTPTGSFARLLAGDTDFSVPADKPPQENQSEKENTPHVAVPTPIPFNSMSIESMYTVWTLSSMSQEANNDEARPRKRMRTLAENEEASNEKDSEPNIYVDVHTKIL